MCRDAFQCGLATVSHFIRKQNQFVTELISISRLVNIVSSILCLRQLFLMLLAKMNAIYEACG
ncbi:MAG: hypothetical protein CMM23_10530 [Rhodospirillaceae bacterium]|jgi:hypothetical protein|nr:hypothetical protein [Rhodospirillaceae bacterium]